LYNLKPDRFNSPCFRTVCSWRESNQQHSNSP